MYLGVRKIPILGSGGQSLFQQVQALFQGGAVDGLWWDYSQDNYEERSSPSTVAVPGAPIGTSHDYSGNNRDLVMFTDARRGVLRESSGLRYYELDGVDDGGSFTGLDTISYDVFCGVQVHDTSGEFFVSSGASSFLGRYDSSLSVDSFSNVGTSTHYVDRVELSPAHRDSLQSALVTNPVVLSVYDMDPVNMLQYFSASGGQAAEVDIYAIVIIESQSAGNRALIEDYVASLCGVSL